ncbi:MAG: YeeE/YedE family protein [Variibacter sp.]
MAAFDSTSALIGGALIGLASVLLMLFTSRVAGISGILTGWFALTGGDKVWRVAFIGD